MKIVKWGESNLLILKFAICNLQQGYWWGTVAGSNNERCQGREDRKGKREDPKCAEQDENDGGYIGPTECVEPRTGKARVIRHQAWHSVVGMGRSNIEGDEEKQKCHTSYVEVKSFFHCQSYTLMVEGSSISSV